MIHAPFGLKDKVIVITGASSGIGRACAVRCAEAGAKLILLGRNEARLLETQALLPEATISAIVPADFADNNLPEDALKQAVSTVGKIHGMIHAAGISTTLPLRIMTAEKMLQFYQTNVVGALMLTKWFTRPACMHADGGSVVFLASVMGLVGETAKSMYSLTKGALIAAARSLALELAPKNIRVNCIAPGVVVTPMTDSAVYSQNEESREKIVSLHPLGLGNTDDVAFASVYLLSQAARWVTGTTLVVDGGYTAR